MDAMLEAHVRPQLQQRRQRLQETLERAPQEADLARLLGEVDAALARVDAGTYGMCETCHDAIETDRLLADPLVRLCLDHLTEREQQVLQADLELASRIQRTLIAPRELARSGWRFDLHVQPAGVVSGDWCDIFQPTKSDDTVFVFGDVSGKGMAAAMLMTHLHATFRSLADEEPSVAALVERANRVFRGSTLSPFFATLVCGRLQPDGSAEITNAGHWPPLLLAGGKVTEVPPNGLPVGTFASSHYGSQRVQVNRGELLLLYTDGLTEARNAAGDQYGDERLRRVVVGHEADGARALIAGLREDLAKHLGGRPTEDDLTLLAIGR